MRQGKWMPAARWVGTREARFAAGASVAAVVSDAVESAAASAAAVVSAAAFLGSLGAGTVQAAPPKIPAPAGLRFTDVSTTCGIDFVHQNGATGTKYAVEILGSGGALLDFDSDGDLDVYLVNGGSLPGSKYASPPENALYENLGGFKFRRVPGAAGAADVVGAQSPAAKTLTQGAKAGKPGANSTGAAAEDSTYGMGAAAADIDNDGDTDLYVTNFGRNTLFRNDGGKFTDITAASNTGESRWSMSAAFADIDADGLLDLYVCNYFKYRIEDHDWYGLRKPGYRTHGGPAAFRPEADVLYRNRGGGVFEDVSRASGILDVPLTHSLGVVAGDFDDDRDVDLFVANDTQANFLFVNDGRGKFSEEGVLAGVAFDKNGKPQASMGVDAGDFDNDGKIDLFCTNFSLETNTLYRGEGNGLYSDVSYESGLGEPSLQLLGFGTALFDFDNDRDLDVFVANGHIMDNVPLYFDNLTYKQRNQLFRNEGGSGGGIQGGATKGGSGSGGSKRGKGAAPSSWKLAEADSSWGPIVTSIEASRAALFGDLDDDGDTDLIVTNVEARPQILRNDGGNTAAWVRIVLRGVKSNRDGFGAEVLVTADGATRRHQARAQYSYLASNDPRLLVGLGNAKKCRIEVRWPSGVVDRRDNVPARGTIVITEGEPATASAK